MVGADDVEGFLDTPAFGDDVLDDQQAFSRLDLESTAQDEFSLLLFHEDEAALQLPRDFLSDDQSAHGRRDDGLDVESGSFRREGGPEALHDGHLLQRLGALEELP